MGKGYRTNCHNVRFYEDKGKKYCYTCKKELTEKDYHEITTRGTARLELKNK